jgi:tetratricopeptide (TPR) repeat protein
MDLLQAKDRLAAAIELRNTSQHPQATESFFSLVKDLDGAKDPDVRKVLAEATVNLGYLIAQDGNAAFAIAVFDRVITQLPEVGYFAVHATVAKADLLREGGHSTEAAACYEQARDSARSRIDELPELASLLGSALMQLGLLYAAEGRTDDAVAAYDEIVARFPQPAGEMLSTVVQARYNRAVVLRNAGRVDAEPAYRTIVEDYAGSDEPEIQRYAAMAEYNLGLVQLKRDDAQAAVDTFQGMVGHFGAASDPVVRQRLAKGFYCRLTILSKAGEGMASTQACSELLQRFSEDHDEVIRQIVAGARRRQRLIVGLSEGRFNGASVVADLDPALRLAMEDGGGGHIHDVLNIIEYPEQHSPAEPLTLEEVIKAVNGPRYAAAEGASPSEQDFAARRNLLLAQLERDLAGHLRCATILRAYLDCNEPFALYLRNFDFEGYLATGVDAGRKIRASLQFAGDDHFESQLSETLGSEIQFLGVGNNAPLRPDAASMIPRMMLSNDGWQDVVEELIRAASVVVMHMSRLTNGVRWEIDAVQRCSATERTIVVLSPPVEVEGPQVIAMAYYGADPSPGQPVTKDSPELAPFHRVIQDAELTGDVAGKPWVSDLLTGIHDIRSLPPEARPRWDGVVF